MNAARCRHPLHLRGQVAYGLALRRQRPALIAYMMGKMRHPRTPLPTGARGGCSAYSEATLL